MSQTFQINDPIIYTMPHLKNCRKMQYVHNVKSHKCFRLMILLSIWCLIWRIVRKCNVSIMSNVFHMDIENVCKYYTELNSERVTSNEDEDIWRVLAAFQHQSLMCRWNPCKKYISTVWCIQMSYFHINDKIFIMLANDFCGRKKCKAHKLHSMCHGVTSASAAPEDNFFISQEVKWLLKTCTLCTSTPIWFVDHVKKSHLGQVVEYAIHIALLLPLQWIVTCFVVS